MDYAKLLQGIVIGSLFSGISLAICFAIIARRSGEAELGFVTSEMWWIAMILGGILGLFAGGIIGGIFDFLNLDLLRRGIYIFMILAFPVGFVLLSNKFNEDIKYFAIAFLIVETLAGIFFPSIKELIFKNQ